jgi:hypothetical protein
MAERAVALMVDRAENRIAFGRPLAEQGRSPTRSLALATGPLHGYGHFDSFDEMCSKVFMDNSNYALVATRKPFSDNMIQANLVRSGASAMLLGRLEVQTSL